MAVYGSGSSKLTLQWGQPVGPMLLPAIPELPGLVHFLRSI
jgi:hypothetical protein